MCHSCPPTVGLGLIKCKIYRDRNNAQWLRLLRNCARHKEVDDNAQAQLTEEGFVINGAAAICVAGARRSETVLAAKVKNIMRNASERYKRVSFWKGNSGNDNNVESAILELLEGLPEDTPCVAVRDLHGILETSQPHILRALDKLQKRGKISMDMQLYDPLGSRVSLPHHATRDTIDA